LVLVHKVDTTQEEHLPFLNCLQEKNFLVFQVLEIQIHIMV